RIAGAGAPAIRGGIPGDLYVHLRVASHPRFERSGADLLTSEHISMTQAALGTELVVTTLDGDEAISIPPGTQSGKVIRLRGRGVPQVRGRGRGDLHVRVFVDTPTELTKDQEQLLRELAASRGEHLSEEEHGIISRIRSSFG
ncbi:MAG: DnaJ C-terminal domain-containing protein, partial [Acidimicrobiales bacterium]